MNLSSVQSKEQPLTYLATCEQTISEIRELNPATYINLEVAAMFCARGILANDTSVLEVVYNGPLHGEAIEDVEQATFIELANIAGMALDKQADRLFYEPFSTLPNALVGIMEHRDVKALHELLRFCNRASRTIVGGVNVAGLLQLGRLSAASMVASYGARYIEQNMLFRLPEK